MSTLPSHRPDAGAELRSRNVRTAALLSAIAALFFGGIIAARYLGGLGAGMTILGTAVVLYLVIAIGRNLRSGK